MKCLTMPEPYASAIAFGMKEYEVRSKPTDYRGLIAIHSGKTFSKTGIPKVDWSNHVSVPLTRRYSGLSEKDFSKGVILAVVELVECIEVDQSFIDSISEQERSLGDWDTNKYAYKLSNLKVLKENISTRGYQGVWNINEDVKNLITEKL